MAVTGPHPRDGMRVVCDADHFEGVFEEGMENPDHSFKAGWLSNLAANAIYTIRSLEKELRVYRAHEAYTEALEEHARCSPHYHDKPEGRS